MYVVSQRHPNIVELIRNERRAFAAKLRVARALLNWSQTDLASSVGLTQRAIHKLEQGETEPRRATVHAVEEVLRAEGLMFEDDANGFRLAVASTILDHAASTRTKQRYKTRFDMGVTAQTSRTSSYRS